jgi:hypothetical protein
MVKKILAALTIVSVLCAFIRNEPITGKWEYGGGIYKGKPENASTDYTLQRQYNDAHYTAVFIEKGEEPITYEKGDYVLKQDTCLETQTYSSQPSKVLNIIVKYHYRIYNDTLTFSGVLPNGTTVQEYWKRVN